MKQLPLRRARLSIAVLAVMLGCFAVPAAASADSVTVRIEGPFSTLVPRIQVTLPTTPVAPTGGPDGETCAGNTVIGAVDAATNHSWNGTWDAADSVWSLDTIMSASALLPDRKWEVLVNGVLSNPSPCSTSLKDGDVITIWPACLGTTTTKCFTQGPLELTALTTIVGAGSPIHLTVWEYTVSLGADGTGTSQRGPSLNAAVTGPDNSTTSDSRYGTGDAIVTIAEKGPATIYASKPSRAGDSIGVCVTDGADGYCGTAIPPQNAFDPYAFCPQGATNGHDGYCGTQDTTAPVGHIKIPGQASKYTRGGAPNKLTGTVDFDPSQTDHVDLRLMRQLKIKVKKLVKKRKVWVTRKIHGKRVRRRVTKKIYKKVTQTACYSWNDGTSAWNRMKKCDPATAKPFRATGAETWSYDFLERLPNGAYTLDAIATDGSGNADTPELGRNRVTFTVA